MARTQREYVRPRPPRRNPDLRMVSFHLDKKLLQQLRMESAGRNMPMSELVREVVKQALANKKFLPPPKPL